MASGCVLSDPPEYGTVKQTPPFLQLDGATPSIYFVKTLDANASQPPSITAQVRSEDAGDELTAVLFFDYAPGNLQNKGTLAGIQTIAPSTIDNLRSFTVFWNIPPNTSGCHQVSMVLTHTNNLDPLKQPIDTSDVAYATWWYDITDDTVEPAPPPALASECGPTPSVTN